MGGLLSCGRGVQISAVAEQAAATVGNASRAPKSAVWQLTETQLDEFREAFNSFDADGGGSIDSSELASVLKSLGQEASPEELAALIKIADTDGSGDIDFLEFVVLVAHKMKSDNDSDQQSEAIKAAFRMFDQNNSGSIDSNEMKRVMLNLGEPIKLAEVNEVIKTFDLDGDGQIDIDEFAAALSDYNDQGTAAVQKLK